RRALFRDAIAAERWTLSGGRAHPAAAPAKNTGSTCLANGSPGPLLSGDDGLRGCALVRPHQPGTVGSGGGPDSDTKRAAGRRLGTFAGTGGPRSLARIVDGAARPARPRQGVGADRGGDRTRVLPSPAGCSRAQAGGGAANGA